jgi:hypothetical protein
MIEATLFRLAERRFFVGAQLAEKAAQHGFRPNSTKLTSF